MADVESVLGDFTNLDDNKVKLVGYNIVSIRPGCERWLTGGNVVVAECMTEEEFIAWIIACFCATYKPSEPGGMEACLERNKTCPADSLGLYPDERKYLRVNYSVFQRWDKPCVPYEEQQVRAIVAIRNDLAKDGG